MTEEPTAGQRMIASARQALAFVQEGEGGCVVHVPDEIDVVRVRIEGEVSVGDQGRRKARLLRVNYRRTLR